jgi:tetratricopeptide (TPR) repeat protein
MQQEYGDLLYGVGRTDLAREAYQRAMQYSPPAVVWRVRNALAKTLDAQGDFAGEIEQLEASIAQHPTQELARARLVSALLAAGRYSDAIAASDSAMYRGINRPMFERLRFTADSAQQARAPAGTVRLRLEAGNFRAERGL